MNDHGFRFLHLPLLTVKNVMEVMDVADLLTISSCNKKVREMAEIMKQVKLFSTLSFEQKNEMTCGNLFELLQIHLTHDLSHFFRANPFSLNIMVSDEISVELRLKEEDNRVLKWNFSSEFIGDMDRFKGKLHYVEIEGSGKIPCLLSEKTKLHMFWNDKLTGFRTFVGWLLRKFPLHVETLTVTKGTNKHLRSIVNFVNYRQNCYKNVVIDEKAEEFSLEVLDFLNRNVSAHCTVKHLGRTSPRPLFEEVVETKDLLISPAHWFTLNHLYFVNCEFVTIVDAKWKNMDLNLLIHNFTTGDFPRLKYLNVKMHDVKVTQVLDANVPRHGFIRDGVWKSQNNEIVPIPRGAVISDLSGRRAATIIYPRPSENRKLMQFEMVVWPDFDGSNFDRNVILPRAFF